MWPNKQDELLHDFFYFFHLVVLAMVTLSLFEFMYCKVLNNGSISSTENLYDVTSASNFRVPWGTLKIHFRF